MTASDFRKIALSLSGAEERTHMNHPDFRVGGRIFATLGWPDKEWAMVKLTPQQQQGFIEKAPEAFQPVKGAWGRQGSTGVYLSVAQTDIVCQALTEARNNLAQKRRPKPRG